MKTFQITFIGREVGAIGIRYEITTTAQGVDADAAVLALYDRFEHITLIRKPIELT